MERRRAHGFYIFNLGYFNDLSQCLDDGAYLATTTGPGNDVDDGIGTGGTVGILVENGGAVSSGPCGCSAGSSTCGAGVGRFTLTGLMLIAAAPLSFAGGMAFGVGKVSGGGVDMIGVPEGAGRRRGRTGGTDVPGPLRDPCGGGVMVCGRTAARLRARGARSRWGRPPGSRAAATPGAPGRRPGHPARRGLPRAGPQHDQQRAPQHSAGSDGVRQSERDHFDATVPGLPRSGTSADVYVDLQRGSDGYAVLHRVSRGRGRCRRSPRSRRRTTRRSASPSNRSGRPSSQTSPCSTRASIRRPTSTRSERRDWPRSHWGRGRSTWPSGNAATTSSSRRTRTTGTRRTCGWTRCASWSSRMTTRAS